MWVKADKTTVDAGHVHIAVKNTGATAHGMAIVAEPVKTTGGMLDESAFLAKGKELAPGQSETVMADLKPGRYELVCFMAGHFAAGQKLPFVVEVAPIRPTGLEGASQGALGRSGGAPMGRGRPGVKAWAAAGLGRRRLTFPGRCCLGRGAAPGGYDMDSWLPSAGARKSTSRSFTRSASS